MNMIMKTLAVMSVLFVCAAAAHAQMATKQDTLKELMRRVDILTEEIEKAKLGKVAELKYESRFGMGPAASRVYQLQKTGVSIAGYGEMVFNSFSDERDDGTASGAVNKFDFVRHIIYVGFRFNDWLLFNSEIEFEHAKTEADGPGEVAVELGYVEAALHPAVNFRAGLLLVPVGLINEFHEPSTFHGALRPETAKRIIPSTWRANGVGFVGATASGVHYKLYLMESLNAARFSSNGIRSGRQDGAKAIAEDMAISGRLTYVGIPGLEFGGSFFLGNTGQAMLDSTGRDVNAGLTLLALHATFARKGLELRGLYARSTIDNVAQLNGALGLTGSSAVGETQSGYYITAAYDILPLLIQGTGHYLAPFVQYEKFDTQDDVPAGFTKNPARERTNITVGLTYKPHPNVAFKLDYINRDNEANTAIDQVNLAVNYLF